MTAPAFNGLSDTDVTQNRKLYGTNDMRLKESGGIWRVTLDIITEPLFILLVIAALIYFILGERNNGVIMILALLFVSGISFYQERKSRNALNALRKLSAPGVKVIRNGLVSRIPSSDLVMHDVFVVEDGDVVPADAAVLERHDFTVNESILTGESLPVDKSIYSGNGQAPADQMLFQGTLVMTGSCIARVTGIGSGTALGKIGESMASVTQEKSPLQIQIQHFVRSMVGFGAVAFLAVWGINFYLSENVLHGLLHGLTIAMSVLPEEIPVAFSTFMALGAYRLYKNKVIARSPQVVETLGAATVICTDKTGTLTENRMELSALYDFQTGVLHDYTQSGIEASHVLEYAMWASESAPFDAMEIAIHHAYEQCVESDRRSHFRMVKEYPLGGNPPMMTHVYQTTGQPDPTCMVACKGSVEGILNLCRLNEPDEQRIREVNERFAQKGYRVLGVAYSSIPESELPENQTDLHLTMAGMIAFYDPPKSNISEILLGFYKAGIEVKMITGDFPTTARAISDQIGLKDGSRILTGSEVMAMEPSDLNDAVKETRIFARMFPEAKLRVVEALKQNGEIVSMTGDGVNDGPALKAAHIGIAMGQRGSEIAKQASALVLTDDDLSHMLEAVALGRRIHENLKKAIQYIISIHIPIILIVTLPLLLFWEYTDLFSPVHVIFLELIMGPTCSVIFENEPAEAHSMSRRPRKWRSSFFSWPELSLSLIQGVVITLFCLAPGYWLMIHGAGAMDVRTAVFITLLLSNVFLTLVNRSFYFSVFTTLKYRNHLIPIILTSSMVVLALSIFFPPAREIFLLSPVDPTHFGVYLLLALTGVLWIELYKWYLRKRNPVSVAEGRS